MPAGWAAGAALVGAGIGAYATMSAADTQAQAAENAANTSAGAQKYATDVQYKMFEKNLELQKPWQEAGQNALNKLTAGINSGQFGTVTPFQFDAKEFEAMRDPGYAFRLAEGQKALERTAAARGGLISGSALKAAERYGQDMGSQEFQNAYIRALTSYNASQQAKTNAYNQLAGVSGTGQTSAQQIGAAGQSAGNVISNLAMTNAANQGNALLSAGQARASAYQGYGSAAGQALGGIGNYLRNYNSGGGYVSGTGYTSASPSGAGVYDYGGSTMEINALPG